MLHQCYKQGCELKVKYICQCLSFDTYSCEFHLAAHLKLPNRTHTFDSIFVEPSKGTKDEILRFLLKEKSKIKKLRKIISTTFRPNLYNSRNSLEDNMSKLNSDLEKNISLIEKISQTSKKEKGQSYNLSALEADADGVRDEAPDVLEVYNSLNISWKLCKLKAKKYPIFSMPNNTKTEQEFRRTCFQYEIQSQASKASVSQAFQDYANAYHQITSLYLIGTIEERDSLLIYDTENETEQVKALEIPYEIRYSKNKFIVQLPSGELFCASEDFWACIIDRNYGVRVVSEIGFQFKTAIHFKGSVYCFGINMNYIHISIRFDIDKNLWIPLALIPQGINYHCHSAIFNEKILISRDLKKKLLLYSIEIDSFTTVPYHFSNESRKILISETERLYLIEWPGFIYESEVWDEYTWHQIANSTIDHNPSQVYCSYNKEGIYISNIDENAREYYKFDLNRKSLTEVAYYDEHVAIIRKNSNLEGIGCYNQTFKLYSNDASAYIQKGFTLWDLGKKLGEIERYDKAIKLNSSDASCYFMKGFALANLGRKEEAIECYDQAIKLNPNNWVFYNNKGCCLCDLGRKEEAIECYNQAIKLNSNNANLYYNKGRILYDFGRKEEATEWYNKAIELNSNDAGFYFNKGLALADLWRKEEAIECYNEAIKLNSNYADIYFNKGLTLADLGRIEEAIECYNQAIKLNPRNEDFYNYKGLVLADLGRKEEAIECYNQAIKLNPNNWVFYNNKGCCLYDLGRKEEAIECYSQEINQGILQ